jgi:hypothetical protein
MSEKLLIGVKIGLRDRWFKVNLFLTPVSPPRILDNESRTVTAAALLSYCAPAGAGVPAGVPEIDPSVASSAIGLLTCGLLSLTAKRKRKREDRCARKMGDGSDDVRTGALLKRVT